MAGSSSWACAVALALAAAGGGCASIPYRCAGTDGCPAAHACVAGRCEPSRPGMVPVVNQSSRVVFAPVDVAFVSRSTPEGALSPHVRLGRDGGTLLLKFAARWPSSARVAEAYVLLSRSSIVDDVPAGSVLHATRIVEPWWGRSTSFARQPKWVDIGLPRTTLAPAGPRLARVDVADLVRLWPRRAPDDHGIAIVVEDGPSEGTTFALLADAESMEPSLEVYLR